MRAVSLRLGRLFDASSFFTVKETVVEQKWIYYNRDLRPRLHDNASTNPQTFCLCFYYRFRGVYTATQTVEERYHYWKAISSYRRGYCIRARVPNMHPKKKLLAQLLPLKKVCVKRRRSWAVIERRGRLQGFKSSEPRLLCARVFSFWRLHVESCRFQVVSFRPNELLMSGLRHIRANHVTSSQWDHLKHVTCRCVISLKCAPSTLCCTPVKHKNAKATHDEL